MMTLQAPPPPAPAAQASAPALPPGHVSIPIPCPLLDGPGDRATLSLVLPLAVAWDLLSQCEASTAGPGAAYAAPFIRKALESGVPK